MSEEYLKKRLEELQQNDKINELLNEDIINNIEKSNEDEGNIEKSNEESDEKSNNLDLPTNENEVDNFLDNKNIKKIETNEKGEIFINKTNLVCILNYIINDLAYQTAKITNAIENLAFVIDKQTQIKEKEDEIKTVLLAEKLYEMLKGKKSQNQLDNKKEKDKNDLLYYMSQPENFLNNENTKNNYIEDKEIKKEEIENKQIINEIIENTKKITINDKKKSRQKF